MHIFFENQLPHNMSRPYINWR